MATIKKLYIVVVLLTFNCLVTTPTDLGSKSGTSQPNQNKNKRRERKNKNKRKAQSNNNNTINTSHKSNDKAEQKQRGTDSSKGFKGNESVSTQDKKSVYVVLHDANWNCLMARKRFVYRALYGRHVFRTSASSGAMGVAWREG